MVSTHQTTNSWLVSAAANEDLSVAKPVAVPFKLLVPVDFSAEKSNPSSVHPIMTFAPFERLDEDVTSVCVATKEVTVIVTLVSMAVLASSPTKLNVIEPAETPVIETVNVPLFMADESTIATLSSSPVTVIPSVALTGKYEAV